MAHARRPGYRRYMACARRLASAAVIAAALVVLPSAAHGAWHQPVGGTSPINQDPSGGANEPAFAGVGGTPYVAWAENDSSQYDVRVSRLNDAGTAWSQVTAAPLDRDSSHDAFEPSIADVGGVPYVAWTESGGPHDQERVSRLNSAATGWDVVGGQIN